MDWMKLAVQLTREAMRSGEREMPVPEATQDLGSALSRQFEIVDRNMDAFAQALNAQNRKLEATVRRQRTWNLVLAIGLVLAIVIALVRS